VSAGVGWRAGPSAPGGQQGGGGAQGGEQHPFLDTPALSDALVLKDTCDCVSQAWAGELAPQHQGGSNAEEEPKAVSNTVLLDDPA
jgi:hypothetical protein